MQFSGDTAQKISNSLQKQVWNQAFWLVSEQRQSQKANQIRALEVAVFA